jgi:hypothetical protein
MLGLGLVFCDLAGHIGDDGSVPFELSGVVVEPGEGGQFDADVDHSPAFASLEVAAVEEV